MEMAERILLFLFVWIGIVTLIVLWFNGATR